MGVMVKKLGERFVITSDRLAEELPQRAAPKRSNLFRVWTLSGWSSVLEDATGFPTEEEADDFVRVNYARVMG